MRFLYVPPTGSEVIRKCDFVVQKYEKLASLIRMYSGKSKIIYPTCLVFLARLVIMEENDASIFFKITTIF